MLTFLYNFFFLFKSSEDFQNVFGTVSKETFLSFSENEKISLLGFVKEEKRNEGFSVKERSLDGFALERLVLKGESHANA